MFFRAAASDGSTDQYDTRQLNAQEVRSQENGYGQQGYPRNGYPQNGYGQQGYPQNGYPQTAMGSRAIRRMGIPRTATGSRHSARHRAAMRHGRAIPRDSVRRAVRRRDSRLHRDITAVRPTASPSVPRDMVTISHAGKLPGRRRRDRIRPGRARPDGNRQSRVRRDRVPVGTVLHESGRVLF